MFRRSSTRVRMMSAMQGALLTVCSFAVAQSAPDDSLREPPDDLDHARRLLEGVRDQVFSFDDPAFYAFCRHLKNSAGDEPPPASAPLPWQYLLERPSDYRGQLVRVEGYLASRQAFRVEGDRRDVGVLFQCELSDAGTRGLCTVVVVSDPSDIPLRSRVRTSGYFLKVRAFQTTDGGSGVGPLVVARRLEMIRPPASLGGGIFERWSGLDWLLAGTAALAVVWFVLRRGVVPTSDHQARRVGPPWPTRNAREHPARCGDSSSTDEDFDWLRK